jgi:hypothetical protein
MKKLDYRYQAIDNTGKVLNTGKLLRDVAKVGKRVIIDYKMMRYTNQAFYPQTNYMWRRDFNTISDKLNQSHNANI